MTQFYLYNSEHDIAHNKAYNSVMDAFKAREELEAETPLKWEIRIVQTKPEVEQFFIMEDDNRCHTICQ